MGDRVWDAFLTERDKQVFDAAGYAQPAGLGKRPAVIVIDVNYHFTGDKDEPILDSIKKWPNSCGEDAWEALPYIKRLLDAARNKGVPVIYIRRPPSVRMDGTGARGIGKMPGLATGNPMPKSGKQIWMATQSITK